MISAISMIKHFEGCKLKPYHDLFANIWSIGYGFTQWDNKQVSKNYPESLTQEQCDNELQNLVNELETRIKSVVTVDLNDNQLSALISFSYNVGFSAFEQSTLLKLINQNDFENAVHQFGRWNKSGGKVVSGLTLRRAAEARLFCE